MCFFFSFWINIFLELLNSKHKDFDVEETKSVHPCSACPGCSVSMFCRARLHVLFVSHVKSVCRVSARSLMSWLGEPRKCTAKGKTCRERYCCEYHLRDRMRWAWDSQRRSCGSALACGVFGASRSWAVHHGEQGNFKFEIVESTSWLGQIVVHFVS